MGHAPVVLFAVLLVVVGATAPGLARRRAHHPVAVDSLLVLMVSVTVWSGGDVLAYDLRVSGPALALVVGLVYLAIGTTVVAFTVLAAALAGTGWRPSRRALVLLAIEPVLAALLAATNSRHGLFLVGPGSRVPTGYEQWRPGPLMWVHLGWVYTMVTVALVVLLSGTWYRPAPLRRQNLLLALSPVPPLLLSTLMAMGYADRSSLGLVASSVIVAFVVRRSDLVVVPAVARTLLVEQLADPLIVLSGEGRVLDLNAAGRRLGRAVRGDLDLEIGRGLGGAAHLLTAEAVRAELDGEHRHFAVQRHLLTNARGDRLGVVVQARDVTDAHAAEALLREQMAQVQALQRRLSYEVDHDALTGLPNRRRLDRGLAQAATGAVPYAVVLADIDRFKSINDRHGHTTGDVVLQHAAAVLLQAVGGAGLLGRWGGEEFVLLLVGEAVGRAAALAEAMRSAARDRPAPLEEASIAWSVSVGVAVMAPGAPAVQAVVAADRALYSAKRYGRDRVVVATS